jgi:hypothetical protein
VSERFPVTPCKTLSKTQSMFYMRYLTGRPSVQTPNIHCTQLLITFRQRLRGTKPTNLPYL